MGEDGGEEDEEVDVCCCGVGRGLTFVLVVLLRRRTSMMIGSGAVCSTSMDSSWLTLLKSWPFTCFIKKQYI